MKATHPPPGGALASGRRHRDHDQDAPRARHQNEGKGDEEPRVADKEAGAFFYGVLALWCVVLGGFSWSMELVWAAVGEFTAAVGYALAVVGVD